MTGPSILVRNVPSKCRPGRRDRAAVEGRIPSRMVPDARVARVLQCPTPCDIFHDPRTGPAVTTTRDARRGPRGPAPTGSPRQSRDGRRNRDHRGETMSWQVGSLRRRRVDPAGRLRRPVPGHPAPGPAQRLHRHRGDRPVVRAQPGRVRRLLLRRGAGASSRHHAVPQEGPTAEPRRRRGRPRRGPRPTARPARPRRGTARQGAARLEGELRLGLARRRTGRRGGDARPPLDDPARRPHRQPDRHHVPDGDVHRHADPHLLDGLHARRPALPAVLRVPVAVLLLDARPGGVGQRLHDLHVLGAGRRLLVPPDRLLVRGEEERRRGEQGVHRQPRRRRRDARRPGPALDQPRARSTSTRSTATLRDDDGPAQRRSRRPTASTSRPSCTTARRGAGAGRRGDGPAPADRRSGCWRSRAWGSSPAAWARAPSSRSTSGSPTRWPGRRPSRP